MTRRRDAQPMIASTGHGSARALEPVPFGERLVAEGWLQDLLFDNPRVLPVEEIDSAFAPLISIGREIGTDVGPIDAMFVNPSGLLTLVETKLWRNPGARREVVGQIIDYAKEVSLWSYEQLDEVARETRGASLWETATRDVDGVKDEAIFVDDVTKNLRRGRFLLLIAGDGIREDVERMASFLQRTPHLHFSLALVELQLFRISTDDGDVLVVPQVVARTQEITRAVVRRDASLGDNVQIAAPALDVAGRSVENTQNINEEEFFESLRASPEGTVELIKMLRDLLDLCAGHPLLDVRWNRASFAVLANVGRPKAGQPSMLVVGPHGHVRFHHVVFPRNLERRGVPADEAVAVRNDYRSALEHLFSPDVTHDVMNIHSGPHLSRLKSSEALERLLVETVERIDDARS